MGFFDDVTEVFDEIEASSNLINNLKEISEEFSEELKDIASEALNETDEELDISSSFINTDELKLQCEEIKGNKRNRLKGVFKRKLW